MFNNESFKKVWNSNVPGGVRSSQKMELRKRATVNKPIISKTYYFTSVYFLFYVDLYFCK